MATEYKYIVVNKKQFELGTVTQPHITAEDIRERLSRREVQDVLNGSQAEEDFAKAWTVLYQGYNCEEAAIDDAGYETEEEMKEARDGLHVIAATIHPNGTITANAPRLPFGTQYTAKTFTPAVILSDEAFAAIPEMLKAGPRPLVELVEAQAPVRPEANEIRGLLRYMQELEVFAKTCQDVVKAVAGNDAVSAPVQDMLKAGKDAQAAAREAAKDLPVTIKIDDWQGDHERHPDAPISLALELELFDNLLTLHCPNPDQPDLPSSIAIEVENGTIAARGYNANSDSPMKLTVPAFPHSKADVSVDEMDYESGRYEVDENEGPIA